VQNAYGRKRRKRDDVQDDVQDDDDTSSTTSTTTTTTNPFASPKSPRRKKNPWRKGDEIYPDLIVARKYDTPKYALVGEVKSDPLSCVDLSQIVCQMIGAGLHQDDVFGVLLAHDGARIMRLAVELEPVRKVVLHINNPYEFSVKSYKGLPNFFTGLVAALDYSLHQTRDPFPDKELTKKWRRVKCQ
jgi:hypothetical protein